MIGHDVMSNLVSGQYNFNIIFLKHQHLIGNASKNDKSVHQMLKHLMVYIMTKWLVTE